jgi:hypothetical protein
LGCFLLFSIADGTLLFGTGSQTSWQDLILGKEIENRKHSITLCPVTETARTKFKQKIIDIMNSSTVTHLDVQNDDILLQIIVDCSALIVGQQYSDLRHEVETLNRELIYNVHVLHTRLMTSMHMPGRISFLTFNLIKLYLLNLEVGSFNLPHSDGPSNQHDAIVIVFHQSV